MTDDQIIYVFQPSSRPYSDQLIVVVPHTQPSLPIPMDLSIAIDIHTARILCDIITKLNMRTPVTPLNIEKLPPYLQSRTIGVIIYKVRFSPLWLMIR